MYVKTKPIHESQIILQENENHVDFQINVIPNYEFKYKILAQGPAIEVISPAAIRDEIKSLLQETIDRYRLD